MAGAGPDTGESLDASLQEKVWMIATGNGTNRINLETTIFTPPTKGPYPLVILNHGKDAGNPHSQRRDRFLVISREFIKRGYAVIIPMRKGFSKSSGHYVETKCDMTSNGQMQAEDLVGTLEYLRGQDWADMNRIVIAGQSYGGLTAMAFGTRRFPGVKGLINFSGGLRMRDGCKWQESLVHAFSNYGAKTLVPSLWFYGQNDSHFNPQLATELHNAYVGAGGQAKLISYGNFKNDAHAMVGSSDGVSIWWPETEIFLNGIGLPTTQIALFDQGNQENHSNKIVAPTIVNIDKDIASPVQVAVH
ncbi:MAG: CocE/NonD family hydrolase [Pseudomonadota bacterium]